MPSVIHSCPWCLFKVPLKSSPTPLSHDKGNAFLLNQYSCVTIPTSSMGPPFYTFHPIKHSIGSNTATHVLMPSIHHLTSFEFINKYGIQHYCFDSSRPMSLHSFNPSCSINDWGLSNLLSSLVCIFHRSYPKVNHTLLWYHLNVVLILTWQVIFWQKAYIWLYLYFYKGVMSCNPSRKSVWLYLQLKLGT